MKCKMFKKILLFASLFCLLFTMLAVSSSALTADDYPTLEDYRAKTSIEFAPYVSGLSIEELTNAMPIHSLRVDDGNGDYEWVPIPVLVQFMVPSLGQVTFNIAKLIVTRLEDGVGFGIYDVTGFDPDGDPESNGAYLLISYLQSEPNGTDYNLSMSYYDALGVDYDLTGENDPIVIYSYEDYYSYLEDYDGIVYNSVSIELVEPSSTETITNNWGEIFGWVVGSLSSVQSVFYTNGGFTFLGTLAVVGVAIAIAFLIIGLVQKFLSLRG